MTDISNTSPSYFGNFSDMDQPTLNGVDDYINDARTLLQDTIGTGYRYDDASLLVALNITLLEARRIRPDLFVFKRKVKGQVQSFTAVDETYVDLAPQFRTAILHGICAHAMERDQEDYQDTRSRTFMLMFSTGLIGKALPGIEGGAGPGKP